MKYCFSTLGCPTWTFKEIITSAKDLGYNGVEIRGVSQHIYAPDIKEFQDSQLDKTVEYLQKLDIEIPILSSSAEFAIKGKEDEAVCESNAYVDLAKKLGAKYVRVLCSNSGKPNGGDLEVAKNVFDEIVSYARSQGIVPLIETNGIFSDTKLLADFVGQYDCSEVGVLWDINHPYRYANEAPATTVKNVGKYIKHVHLKDSIVDENGNIAYKMLGSGDLPIKDVMLKLNQMNYSEYVSLEWTKRWNKDLEKPSIALYHFMEYMRSL